LASCGGAYNVDSVLATMVRGLEEELKLRTSSGSDPKGNNNPLMNEILASPGPDIPNRKTASSTSMGELRQQGTGAGLGRLMRSTRKLISRRSRSK